MRITRTPLFFGPERRSLFGWLHAPADAARDLAVVLCPPVGHEYINSHRPLRHLADRLAEAGVPVLRFDYDGTGDSAGRDEERERVGAWTQSVQEAVQVLRELCGCSRIALVGVRLGATLAVAAAAHTEMECLVLWAPCVRGRAYAREMKALHLTASKFAAGEDTGHIEPGGFLMTEETQQEIGCLDLGGSSPKTKRLLIITRDDLAEDTRLRDEWMAAGIAAEQRALPGFTEMFLPPHNAVVPEAVIAETVAWIVAGAGELRRTVAGTDPVRREQRITEGEPPVEIRESIVLDTGLFGILSEPVEWNAESPTILLSNAGSVHHVGPNRLYVLLARRLARAGFRCLRLDLPGLGDNMVGDTERENDPYLSTASSVIDTAIARMRQHANGGGFVLMGLCSGAHTSFHATLDLDRAPIVESMLINPLTFYYRPGMPLDVPAPSHYEGLKAGIRSRRGLERFVKQWRTRLRIALYRALGIRPTTAVAFRIKIDDPLESPDLESDLRRIVESGRKLTFVFARFDPGYDLLMINAAHVVKRFRKEGLIRLWRIDDANHTFEAKRSREVMIDSVVTHLSQRYG